ncbi:MAG: asparagine synthase C-terminal domain-containing protein [Tannerellaceae bacterium]|jgi:asparagine synthase (glutamine-hydrolysing)|nr:asparagine synthase C-terminal domain-containing protein [Tannerellaceae bacterium]
MIKVELIHNEGYPWHSANGVFVKGKCLNARGEALEGASLARYFEGITDEDSLISRIEGVDGLYSLIILSDNRLLAAVDRLRNFPLLYSYRDGLLKVSDSYTSFLDTGGAAIDRKASAVMLRTGYVAGDKTLLEGVSQLISAQYMVFDGRELRKGFHYKIHSAGYGFNSREGWKEELRRLLLLAGRRLSVMVGERPVALPLSGGYDSRLICLMLKLNGHKDVTCFSYGNPSHCEAKCSADIAAAAGYPWIFVDYKPYINTPYTRSKDFPAYADLAGNAISFPYIQEYFAARFLKEDLKLPRHTIIIPGHSGDTLAGSHLFPDMKRFKSADALAKKVCRLMGKQVPAGRADKRLLLTTIAHNTSPRLTGYSHLMHDDWNITERQSKQTVNSSKVWNFFGYEYLLPLWDKDLTDFFASLPFDCRVYKNLYDETLRELFAHYGLISAHETSLPLDKKKAAYRRLKIKERLPFLAALKRKKKPYNDFFYFDDLIRPMLSELDHFRYNENNGVLSAWYIKQVTARIREAADRVREEAKGPQPY